jgi:hypothetical protein
LGLRPVVGVEDRCHKNLSVPFPAKYRVKLL